MLAHGDFVYAAESTTFQVPFVNLALVPEFGSSYMKRSVREQLERAVRFENEEFAARVRSAEAKEAFTAFFAKRRVPHDA
jgi:enoyl-CoA hydratase/carnithine racemase